MARFGMRSLAMAVVILAIAARMAVMTPRIGRAADDPDNYLPLARSIASGQGFEIHGKPTAYRPPLYPVLLAAMVGTTGTRFTIAIAAMHLVLGAATCGLTMVAAHRWGLSPTRVLIAGLIVAVDPVLVVQSRSVMTETLAACLLSAAVASASDLRIPGALGSGLAFGLASLCRPSTLPAAGVAALFAATTGPGSWRTRLARSSAIVVLVLVVLTPWTFRNLIVFGEPIATTTHGGYTLALANNPAYYRDVLDGPPGAVWSGPNQRAWFVKVAQQTDGMSEPDADRFLRREAITMFRDHPGAFLRASAARLGRFWGLAPSGAVYGAALRRVSTAWTLPFWIAVILGLMSRETWRWPCASSLAIILAVSGVHTIYWTDLRMRAPLVPSLALVAVLAVRGGRKKKFEKCENAPSCAVQKEEIG